MPIKPEKRILYPANWKEIVALVRKRSKNRCELCAAPNEWYIARWDDCPSRYDCCGKDAEIFKGLKGIVKVVLTVAHINQDPTDNRPANLLHLCQRCHNRIDLPYRMVNAARTRASKKGKKFFEEGES